MKFLHDILEKQKPLFEKGGKFEQYYYLFEAAETFAFTPPTTTASRGVQVRDAIDLKRMMMTVVFAMVPCLLFGIWNVGYQHNLATGAAPDLLSQIIVGLKVTLPIIIVSYTVGGLAEVVFAVIRKHPINEGFLVTGMLIPLVMPPTIPLWQVALATLFAVIIAKEAFGGTGMNVLNVAMTARAFLYFAYPSDISGEVWTYIGGEQLVDGYTGATALAIAANASEPVMTAFSSATAGWTAGEGMFTPMNMLIGTIPGSIGETSAIFALVGAIILIATGVGSWRIIVGCVIGALLMGGIFNAIGYNAFMSMPAHLHLIMGGFAFGAVFMATDPVSAAHTGTGKWIYGILIGLLTVLIRVFNPAYPEGIMLAVLLMNVFAPLIDFYVVEANKKRRLKRATL